MPKRLTQAEKDRRAKERQERFEEALGRALRNSEEMHAKEGPLYEAWKARMKAWAERL